MLNEVEFTSTMCKSLSDRFLENGKNSFSYAYDQNNPLRASFDINGIKQDYEFNNFYQSYLNEILSGKSDEEVVHDISKMLCNIFNEVDVSEALQFDKVKNRIYPFITTKTTAEQTIISSNHKSKLVYKPLIDNLIISYIIDNPDMVNFILDSYLKIWNITEEELAKIAEKNFKTKRLNLEKWSIEPGVELYSYQNKDVFGATHIINAKKLREFERKINKKLIFAIPHRDLFIAMPRNQSCFIKTFKKFIVDQYLNSPYKLSPELYVIYEGAVKRID